MPIPENICTEKSENISERVLPTTLCPKCITGD